MAAKVSELEYNSNGTAVTVPATYSDSKLTKYDSTVVTIDASARAKAINITGNAKGNSIKAGAGNDTLDGGKGDDILTGGSGKDIFIYSSGGGNDTVSDYTAGEDSIKIASAAVSDFSISGADVIFKVGSGNVNIKNGKTTAINFSDSKNKSALYQSGAIYNNAAVAKASGSTISANYESKTFEAGTAMVTVDASARTGNIEIVGNSKNNKIIGGSGNDTLYSGAGNDTLTGGKGSDIFVYEGGNDIITDYTEGEDSIKFSNGNGISNFSASGSDVVIKSNLGKSVKVKNVKNKAISISEGTASLIYQNGLVYGGANISTAKNLTVTSMYGKELSGISSSIESIDASARTAAIKITGNSKNNSVTGTKKNDTLDGGAGNDYIEGGAGNDILTGGADADVFIYTEGDGKDTITDYGTGADIISLAGDYDIEYSYKTVKGGGGNSTFKIGKGSITLKDSADTSVTIIGANGEASIANNKSFFAVNDIPDVSQGLTVTVTVPGDAETITVYDTITVGGGTETVYDTITVPGAAETVTVYDTVTVEVTLPAETVNVTLPAETITAYDTVTVEVTLPAETVNVTLPPETVTVYDTITVYGGGSSVIGTSAAEILYGTAGNDTVSLGAGADTYIYNGGFDIIQDYAANADKISIGANSVSNYGVIGNDGIFFVAGGILKLTGAKDKKVTIISGGNETEYDLTVTSTTPTVQEGKTVTLEANSGDFNLTTYNTTAEETYQHIDASKVTNSIKIYGDSSDNIIKAGKNGGNIYVGSGDDIVYFGNGNDTITLYQEDRGNKTVYNYRAEDLIVFSANNSQFLNFSFSGNDVIFNLTNGTITLKDSKDKNITYSYYYSYNNHYNTATFGKVSFSEDTVSLDKNYTGAFYLTNYSDEATNIDASNATGSIELHADDSDNVIRSAKGGGAIYAGRGDDTIYGSNNGNNIYVGSGDDTVYFGNGNDTITLYQEDRGNKTVYDYKAEDLIVFSTNNSQFSNFSFSGDDVIFNLTNGGTITLKDSKDKNITYSYYYSYNNHYNTATFGKVSFSDGTISLDKDYTGYFDMTYYADEATNIDASAATGSIELHADDSDNVIRSAKGGGAIYAGRGDDTIYGSNNGNNIYVGSGDDTVYFGNGNDTITLYQEDRGNKTVYDYKAEDLIVFSTNNSQFLNFSFSGNDVIFNLTNGTITLKDSKDKNITYSYYYSYNNHYNTATFGKVSFSNDTVSLDKNYTGDFYLTYYADEATNIDASNATGSIELHADTDDNVIKAAKGGSNIYAGKGEDSIYCGNGNDTIRYYQYDGNETVYNIGNEDQIILNNCTAQNVSVKGNDVIISTSSNETITLKEGTGKRIFITGQNWQTYTASNTSARVAEEKIWFLEDDNNFVTSDIDSITQENNSLTNLNLNPVETENIFAQDNLISYNYADKK